MPVEAMVDFTGGFPEVYEGPDYGPLKGVATDLFKEMQRALEERPGVLISSCSLIQKYRYHHSSGRMDHVSPYLSLGARGLQEAMPTR